MCAVGHAMEVNTSMWPVSPISFTSKIPIAITMDGQVIIILWRCPPILCQSVRCANHNFGSFHNFYKISQPICNRPPIVRITGIRSFIHFSERMAGQRTTTIKIAATALQFSRHCPCARGSVTSKSNGIVYYNKYICVAH